MNIIYFHTHDMGRFCEPYGYKIETPNLQRFAEDGVVFRNAFCTSPTCSPSRAALLTGQYPHQNGMFGLSHKGAGSWKLNDYNMHLAAFMKRNGYITALSGTQHEDEVAFETPPSLPYDEILSQHASYTETDKAIEFLKRNSNKKFFLSVGFGSNHHLHWEQTQNRLREYYGEIDGRYSRPLPHLPDTPDLRQEAALFYRTIKYYDLQVGRIIQFLRESGLDQNTLIFLTTDHGPGFSHSKMTLYDSGVGAMLMMQGPGLKRGQVLDALVSHVDVFPTICEMIDAPKPEWLEGKSLMTLLNNEVNDVNEEIYLEQNYHCDYYIPLRAVRTKRYKYIKLFRNDVTLEYSTDPNEGASHHMIKSSGLQNTVLPEEMLFDLYLDTNESHNVVNDEQYKKVADELRAKLTNWMIKTNDPARSNNIPKQISE